MKTDKTGLEQFVEWLEQDGKNLVDQTNKIMSAQYLYKAQSFLKEEQSAMEKAQGQQDGGLRDELLAWSKKEWKTGGTTIHCEKETGYAIAQHCVGEMLSRHPQSVEAQKPKRAWPFLTNEEKDLVDLHDEVTDKYYLAEGKGVDTKEYKDFCDAATSHAKEWLRIYDPETPTADKGLANAILEFCDEMDETDGLAATRFYRDIVHQYAIKEPKPQEQVMADGFEEVKAYCLAILKGETSTDARTALWGAQHVATIILETLSRYAKATDSKPSPDPQTPSKDTQDKGQI